MAILTTCTNPCTTVTKYFQRTTHVLTTVPQNYQNIHQGRDSLLVKASDSWSKGCEFESQQERQENFLLQSQLCVLTLIRCPFHPHVKAVAHTRSQSFCQKCRWQVTAKHTYTLDPTKLEWADYAAVQALSGNLLGNELMSNSSGNTRSVVSACWATMDWSWPKEWNQCVQANFHFKKKRPAGNELLNILPKSLHARKKPPPPFTKATNWLWYMSLTLHYHYQGNHQWVLITRAYHCTTKLPK